MAGAEVLEDSLEELLTYSDLFLDYFNAFLALPAFPIRLHYDPLTSKVYELDRDSSSKSGQQPKLPSYGATDEERERTLEWLKQERWPPFKTTLLYLEYKLAKLLLRRLDDQHPVSRHGIRGYSCHSNSTTVSSLPSHSSTPGAPQPSPSQGLSGMNAAPLQRMPSRTHSTPANIGRLSRFTEMYLTDSTRQGVLQGYYILLDLQEPGNAPHSSGDDSRDLLVSDSWLGVTDGLISPVLFLEFTSPVSQLVLLNIYIMLQGHTRELEFTPQDTHILVFSLDEELGDSEDEEEYEFPESVRNSSLQKLKEAALGTREGIESFREFLQGTLGISLLHFWIDCEDLKERTLLVGASDRPEEAQRLCTQLLRCIRDKYKYQLSPESQAQMRVAQDDPELALSTLSRSQYGALRRLRSYWVPRFLIHQQRIRTSLNPSSAMKTRPLNTSDFMPCISVAPSLPVSGSHSVSCIKRTGDWCSVRLLTPHKNENPRVPSSAQTPDAQGNIPEALLMDKLLTALKGTSDMGCAFLYYLTRFESADKTRAFLLWRDLEDLRAAEARRADRHYIQCLAWRIFNKYLLCDAAYSVGLGADASAFLKNLHIFLSTCPTEPAAMAFEPVAERVLAVLCAAWIRYLRYDIASFLEECVPSADSSTRRNQSVKEDTQGRAQKRGRNSIFTHGVQGQQKKRKKKMVRTTELQHPNNDPAVGRDADIPKVPLELLRIQTIFNAYKKTVQETEDKKLQQVLDFLQRLNNCQNAKCPRQQLHLVMQLMDQDILPKALSRKLKAEISQGKICHASLDEIRNALTSILADSFECFWMDVSEGLKGCGVQPVQLEQEAWTRLESLLYVVVSKVIQQRLKIKGGKLRQGSRAVPTEDDKEFLFRALEASTEGWPTLEMLHFLKYLETYGPKEEMPLLENHLLFCLEVLKFRNAHQTNPDRTLLKKKVQVIRDCFLTTKFEPSLQITLDTERFERAMKAVNRSIIKDITSPSLFDELHEVLLNSLLPFWAGFRKTWQSRTSASAQRPPELRAQRLLERRLAHFVKARDPTQLFQLPSKQSLSRNKRSAESSITYHFSICSGLTLKEDSANGTRKGFLPSIPSLH
uniref:Uncharacterized protein LOC117357305 n=1 Tax=Geotrypetes seraphini TaxID=260995 RepID=A0A6P8Q0A7_GEOSA|nr:uncharacterized protein LOC117357305 [Geotrypetes seraphini]